MFRLSAIIRSMLLEVHRDLKMDYCNGGIPD